MDDDYDALSDALENIPLTDESKQKRKNVSSTVYGEIPLSRPPAEQSEFNAAAFIPSTSPRQTSESRSPNEPRYGAIPNIPRISPPIQDFSRASNRISYKQNPTSGDLFWTIAPKDISLPDLEGYLEKKGEFGVIKTWRKRYFVLREDKFLYYRTKEDQSQENLIGFISLANVVVEQTTGGFQIKTKDRIWHLRVENPDEVSKWVEAVRVHSLFEEPPTPRSVRTPTRKDMLERTGYVDRMVGGKWVVHWIVLKDGILYNYKNRGDIKPMKIPLYKCTLEEHQIGSEDPNTFKLVLGNGKSFIFRATSKDDMHEWLNGIMLHRTVLERIIGFKDEGKRDTIREGLDEDFIVE